VVHERDYRSLQAEDDPLDITLNRALELLAQPKRRGRRSAAIKPLREIGAHPGDEEPIALYEGRYGPYVKHGKTNASLPKGVEPEDVTIDMALELLEARRQRDAAKKSKKRSKRSSKAAPKRSSKASPKGGSKRGKS
jgi:DNA topoisomerase-1